MNDLQLDGRVALVTGASSGIGRACALELAGAGARVAVNYHNDAEAGRDVVETIASGGGHAMLVRADISDESEVASMLDAVARDLGTPHILVNNAGIQRDACLLDMSVEQWDEVIATNLRGHFLCTRAFARRVCAAPAPDPATRRGSIVFVSSVHQRIPWSCHANYAASKGGVDMLMRSVALELGAHGIRVNSVAPGAVRTAINRDVLASEAGRREVLAKIPIGRIGEPADIARAVVWLASPASDYVHGHTLYIDGGMTLYPSFADSA